MKQRFLLIFVIALILLNNACGGSGQIDEEVQAAHMAETMVAQTLQASDPTSIPTDTPEPTSTFTVIPPTLTPTVTPTPGPIMVNDDFSENSGIWSGCDDCVWRDGILKIGPYDDPFQAVSIICDECGTTSNYRMAVDATFIDGMAGSPFGFILLITEEFSVTFTIVPSYQRVQLFKNGTKLYNEQKSVVKTGLQKNHLEVVVRDSQTIGRSDITLKINGKTIVVYSGIKVDPTKVGLFIYSETGIAFDNFEFEELR